MSDCMRFPDTVEEFMEQYKMTDTKQVYSNGTEYVPIFRMEQWFEHERRQPEPHWIPCTERMPEKTPLWKTIGYLATVTCDSWKEPRTMYVKWETTTVRGKEVSRWTFDNRLFPSEWHVVAWMPMPEAYKEGGERI